MTDLGLEAKLRAAFEISPTLLCVTTLGEGLILEANDAFLRTSGYAREQAVGHTVTELALWVDPQQRADGLAQLRTVGSVRNVEARLRTRDGGERVVIISADIIELDGRPCILNAMMDITDRTRAEAALRESEQRFSRLFHANPLPMTITSLPDGRHLDVNEAAVRHGGYTREEMLGRTKVELGFWVAPAQRARLLDLLRDHGAARDYEVAFRTKGGDVRQLLVNSDVIVHRGQPAVLSVSIDITERKQAEAEVEARRREAEALTRAKDEFLAMLGHELRNPLGTITNTLAALGGLAGSDAARHLVGIVDRQTAHLTRLVDDLLDVARVTSGKIPLRAEPGDLHALAARSLDALAQAGRTLEHEVALEGGPVAVYGDPARLQQVVTNLVDNALKYTPAGGRVTVAVRRDGRDAVLAVRDTGSGIAPDLLPHVFDLFVQGAQGLDRTRGGLGLGLTLVKRLVELHGGSVTAASAGPDRGSEFTVRVPAAAAPIQAPPPAMAARAAAPAVATSAPQATAGMTAGLPQPPRRRVLIVEDRADARESLRLLLELAGHEVEACEDGRSGLRKLRSFRPEVALVDLGLPGLDGYTLARRARRNPRMRGVRLVALTGYGQVEDRHRALEAGFDAHVTKPVDPATLRELLAPR